MWLAWTPGYMRAGQAMCMQMTEEWAIRHPWVEGTRGLMGSLKALVFLRAHLVLLPRRIHFLVLHLNACGPQQITGQVLICNRTALGETSARRRHPVPSERGNAIKWRSASATVCPVCGGHFSCLIWLEVVRFFFPSPGDHSSLKVLVATVFSML